MKSAIKRKNVYLDETKIQRAQRILGTQSDTDTIDRALDLVVFRKKILQSLEQTAGKGLDGKSMTSDEKERRRRAIAAAGRFHSGHSDLAAEHDRHLAEAYQA
ncbi:MAG: hypothetical protein HYZ50_16165 [Deltaproteobacteria bacterium]|nr:hypothetical protein [Deltaproteobacteria bacterium]